MIRTPQLAAFRYKNYTLTWLANLFSGAALWTVIVASGWLLFTETNSSGWVGILTFSSMFPLLIASPVGGLIGDKYDRKKIVVFMFIASSLIVLFGSGSFLAYAINNRRKSIDIEEDIPKWV